MKKSEQYRFAQIAVLKSMMLDSSKLEIIKTLMNDEETALWSEKREAERAESEKE